MDLEETLLEKRSEFKEVSTKVNGMFEKAPEMFHSAYEQLKAEEDKYSSMADDLKVPFILHIPKEQCEINLEQIDENIGVISQSISGIMENADFDTPEGAISSASIMQKYGESARRLKDTQNVLFDMIKDYADEASEETQKGFDEKIQKIIRDTKLQLLRIRRQDLQDSRISFFGRLFGAETLKEIELENLDLEESILRNSPIQQKSSYSASDSLADMRAFVIKDLKKQDTIDTKSVFYTGIQVFGLSAEVIDEKAQRKLHSVPMVMSEPRKKPRTADKIQKAKQRNSSLEAELLEVNSIANRLLDGDTKQPETVAQKFASLLRETVIYTSPEYITNEREFIEKAKANSQKVVEANLTPKKPKEKETHELDTK